MSLLPAPIGVVRKISHRPSREVTTWPKSTLERGDQQARDPGPVRPVGVGRPDAGTRIGPST